MLVGSSCDRQIILRISRDVFIFKSGLRFEGLFWERYILKGQIAFEKHWRLQSWTLILDVEPILNVLCSNLHTDSQHASTGHGKNNWLNKILVNGKITLIYVNCENNLFFLYNFFGGEGVDTANEINLDWYTYLNLCLNVLHTTTISEWNNQSR